MSTLFIVSERLTWNFIIMISIIMISSINYNDIKNFICFMYFIYSQIKNIKIIRMFYYFVIIIIYEGIVILIYILKNNRKCTMQRLFVTFDACVKNLNKIWIYGVLQDRLFKIVACILWMNTNWNVLARTLIRIRESQVTSELRSIVKFPAPYRLCDIRIKLQNWLFKTCITYRFYDVISEV